MRNSERREMRLTGRVRARPAFLGRQVMQVERATLYYSACPPMPGSDPVQWVKQQKAEGVTAYEWRDATWEDVALLTAGGVLGPRSTEPTLHAGLAALSEPAKA